MQASACTDDSDPASRITAPELLARPAGTTPDQRVLARPWQGPVMGWFWQAIGLFVVTNIDDLVLLSLFYGRARAVGGGAAEITVGQYVGFLAILVASVAGALGAALLPATATRYLGVIPILIGVRAGWSAWRDRHEARHEDSTVSPGVITVAGVTLANGGDNIGVYIPAFTTVDKSVLAGSVLVFLAMVAVWCLAAFSLTGHPRVAAWILRWGHVVYPIALIAIGTDILLAG